METNLTNAYKSLGLVVADPGFSGLAPSQQDVIKQMMAQIRNGLIALAQAKAVKSVDASLS